MARRRKSLVDVVRDGTFLARKDAHLLDTREKLFWPPLERVRKAYRLADDTDDRREIALGLEKGLRTEDGPSQYLGDLQSELRKLGPHGSYQQLERFFPRFLRHKAGTPAARPFRLAKFQREFLTEFWRRDRNGRRVYSRGLLMIPKGNGKTPLAAGLGLHALVTETDAPEVYNIAGSKDQAGICFDFAKSNIDHGALGGWLDASAGMIRCSEHRGDYEILSSDGYLSAGVEPTAAVYDELFLARHAHQREAWTSQEQALMKRSGRSWLLGISTAGFDKQTLLGERYDAAVKHPKLELRNDDYLLVLRDEENGFLFWCYQAPDDADVESPAVLRKCNPARWIDPRDMLPDFHADELDARRLHANQWTKTKQAWLSSGVWARLRSDAQIPEGAAITVGIDAARTFDTTAVGWTWVTPEGRKVSRAHVWSVRRNVPHHTFVDGGELVNEELVEPFVHALAQRYSIRGIALDPRYLNAEAKHLADEGFTVVKVEPQSAAMQDAVVLFEKEAMAQRLQHDGDAIVSAHVDAIDSVRRPDGSKKIGKRNEGQPIDAGIAMILSSYLQETDLPDPEVEYVFNLAAYCQCGHPENRHERGALCTEPGCTCVQFVEPEAE